MSRLHCWGLQPLLRQQVGSSHEGSVSDLAQAKAVCMLMCCLC